MQKQTNALSTGATGAISAAVILAALGYFVDIYDLILFSIVRVPSLKALGLADAQLLDSGVHLLNMQMGGMLIGGIIWGVLGDLRGRLSVLFGSIALYSLANIANGFVSSVDAYAWLRLIAGIGLAGELGAGITLVSESLHKEHRGYGTTIVVVVGTFGAVVAWLVGDQFNWRTAYFVGGGLGILLLLVRFSVYESGMFTSLRSTNIRRGNFFLLFSSFDRALRYVSCIMIGVPIWFVIGILITFSPEIGKALGMPVPPDPGKAVMLCYVGLVIGDLASGVLSQRFRSRRRVTFGFLCLTLVVVLLYILSPGLSLAVFYPLCVMLGFAAGYWAVFVTIASEQFGTNIRATATTTVPNFVRGAVVLLTSLLTALKPSLGILWSAGVIGLASILVAMFSLWSLDETYGKDLDYVEGVS
jgi:MFS family permease